MAFTGVRERLDIGRVVSMTFAVIRSHFPALVALSALFYLPPLAMRIGFQRFISPYMGLGITVGSIAILTLVWISVTVAGAALQSAVTPLVNRQLHGGSTSIRSIMAAIPRKILPLSGAGLIFGLGVALGLFLLIIPGLVLAARWCAAAPALAAEGGRVRQALARSRKLTEGSRWRILVLIVLNYAFSIAVGVTVQRTLLALAPLNMGLLPSHALGLIASSFDGMVATVGAAVLYAELRRIHDGMGLANLGEVFD